MIQRASGFDNPQIKLGDFLGVCAFHHDDHISLFEGELLIDRISVKCLREAKSQDIRNYLNRTVSRLFFHDYGVWHVYLTPERPVVEPHSFNDVPKHTTLVADIISMVSEKQVLPSWTVIIRYSIIGWNTWHTPWKPGVQARSAGGKWSGMKPVPNATFLST